MVLSIIAWLLESFGKIRAEESDILTMPRDRNAPKANDGSRRKHQEEGNNSF